MALKNTDLLEFALNRIGTPYVMGTNGKVLTSERLNELIRQNPRGWFNTTKINGCQKFIGLPTTDCHGLIEWFVREKSGKPYDTTANMAYNEAISKGNINSLPEIPGIILHKDGHVGIYIGNGYAVEARGYDFGVCVTRVKDRGWEHWFKHKMIAYNDTEWKVPNVIKSTSDKAYIVWLQIMLNRQIDLKNIPDKALTVDGIWGIKTAKAVKNFWYFKGWDKTAMTSSGYGIGKSTVKALKE